MYMNAIFIISLLIQLKIVRTQPIDTHHFIKSTVFAINAFYEDSGHPKCTIKRGFIRCSDVGYCHFQCSQYCSVAEDICIYSTLSDNDQCFICVFKDGDIWIQTADATMLDSSAVVYTREHQYMKYPNEGCDLVPVYNGDEGHAYSDENRAQGRTLTAIEFCLSVMNGGEGIYLSINILKLIYPSLHNTSQ